MNLISNKCRDIMVAVLLLLSSATFIFLFTQIISIVTEYFNIPLSTSSYPELTQYDSLLEYNLYEGRRWDD